MPKNCRGVHKMGNTNKGILEFDLWLQKQKSDLIFFHGPEKTFQVMKFAHILYFSGQHEKAYDLVNKACNKNWEKGEKKCQQQTKSKSRSGFRLVYPLLGLFLNLLKKLLK